MVFLQESIDQILNVITSVIQIAGTRNFLAIHDLLRAHVRYICQSCKHALTVHITEASFYIVFPIQFPVNGITFLAQCSQMRNFRCNLKQIFCHKLAHKSLPFPIYSILLLPNICLNSIANIS